MFDAKAKSVASAEPTNQDHFASIMVWTFVRSGANKPLAQVQFYKEGNVDLGFAQFWAEGTQLPPSGINAGRYYMHYHISSLPHVMATASLPTKFIYHGSAGLAVGGWSGKGRKLMSVSPPAA